MISSDNNVTFILGPTNTGKTFMAIERMVSYDNGIIGLPLRLLAREVYDKIVIKKGKLNTALITGEEQMDAANCIYGKGRRFVPFVYLNQKPLGTFGDLYKLH